MSETMTFSSKVIISSSTACKRFFDSPNGVIDDFKLAYSMRFFGSAGLTSTTTRAVAHRLVMERDAVKRYPEEAIQRLFELLFMRMSPITDTEIMAEYRRMGGGMGSEMGGGAGGGTGGSHATNEHLEQLALDMSLTEASRWLLTETERDSGLARIVLRYTGFTSMDDVRRVIMIRDMPAGGGVGVGSQLRAPARVGKVMMV